VSRVTVQDIGDKASIFGDDHKEREEVLYIRGSGEGRQGSEETVPCLQLPVDDEGEAIYLYDADATGWWMESDPVQFGGFYAESIRNKLCGDTASADSRKLPNPKDLFLGSPVFGGWAAPWIQAVFAGSEAQVDAVQYI